MRSIVREGTLVAGAALLLSACGWSLEETAATTEELAASVKASAQASRQAAAIATEAMERAQGLLPSWCQLPVTPQTVSHDEFKRLTERARVVVRTMEK